MFSGASQLNDERARKTSATPVSAMAAVAPERSASGMTANERVAILAASLGTVVEWYDLLCKIKNIFSQEHTVYAYHALLQSLLFNT
jgi:hypothetical protein